MDQVKTGQTISQLRKEVGLTQAGLAEKLGITDKAVSKWERGICCPDVSLWNHLSILLDTDIESIIYAHEGRSEWKGAIYLQGTVPSDIMIFNKPLIHYLLSPFLLAGINDIAVIGNCDPIPLPGAQIKIVDRPDQLNHWFTKSTFIIYGNRFLYGPNLTRHLKRAMSHTDGITVLSTIKGKGPYPIAVDTDRKAKLTKKFTGNQNFAEPFVFIPKNARVSRYFNFEDILKEGDFNTESMGRGMVSFNICNFEDAFRLSEYIRLMEELTGERIGCVEEILIRRGLADYREIKKVCNKEVKQYLEGLSDEG